MSVTQEIVGSSPISVASQEARTSMVAGFLVLTGASSRKVIKRMDHGQPKQE
jgi:hypothetical protein